MWTRCPGRCRAQLADALQRWHDDPRLVAVGEIGLDGFVPGWQDPAHRARQEAIYAAQLALAAEHGLPVILHVRRTADVLLEHLALPRCRPACDGRHCARLQRQPAAGEGVH